MVETQTDELPQTEPTSDEVTRLQTKLDEVLRAYARAQQDREDFRRRAEREKERVLEVERGKVALSLIEVADQLDLSLSAISPDTACKDCEGLATGVRLIRDDLLKQLERGGITRLAVPESALFDPTLHEAVETLPVAVADLDGRVVQERRPGYRQGERVLRPARVSVGRFLPGGNN